MNNNDKAGDRRKAGNEAKVGNLLDALFDAMDAQAGSLDFSGSPRPPRYPTPSQTAADRHAAAMREFADTIATLFDTKDQAEAAEILLGPIQRHHRAEDDPEYWRLVAALPPEDRADLVKPGKPKPGSAKPKTQEQQTIDVLGPLLDGEDDDS